MKRKIKERKRKEKEARLVEFLSDVGIGGVCLGFLFLFFR